MTTKLNQFVDKFRFLKTEDAKIRTLRTRVTQILNRLLPSRILSKANIFNLTLDLAQDFTNMMMFYIEDSLQESNILVAEKESSVRGLAALTGHKATRAISSRGVIKCSLKQGLQLITPKLVLSNVVVINESNKLQYTAKINGDVKEVPTSVQSFELELIEGEIKTSRFVATGEKLYTIRLDDTRAIENYDIVVKIDSDIWKKHDNLYELGSNNKGYVTKNGIENQVDIVFGDDVHGLVPAEGSVINVSYRLTNGEFGNLQGNEIFNVSSGVYDANGNEIDIAEYIDVTIQSGFSLGSNGEDIELTRTLAGHHSRAHVLLRPENVKAYLSRLSILSQIDVWTVEDDQVFNMLLLPNLMNKLNRFSDYLYMNDDEFKLQASVKEDIKTMINASKRQATSSEIVIHDPVLKKYAMFIYIDAVVNDKDNLRSSIEDKVSAIMIENTFNETEIRQQTNISKSAIVDALYDMPEIKSISIDIISEANETARINGSYDKKSSEYVGSVKKTTTKKILVPVSMNPSLGFSDLGDLVPENRNSIPVLRGGFKRFVDENNTVDITKPIYIFYKDSSNNWNEL